MQEVNFLEIFALTIRRVSLRIYLALYLMLNLFIYQVDIISAYLKSLLSDKELPIFMKRLPETHNLFQVREGL